MNHKKIILLRHGQSAWNLENRFTGWTDVDLTDLGRKEAHDAGIKIAKAGIMPEYYFTSFQRRAITTLNIAAEAMNREWVQVTKDWRLNERHYGALQGLNKADTITKYGEEQVLMWRRSYDVRPPQIDSSDPRYPGNLEQYKVIPQSELPTGESLKDTISRVSPCFEELITPRLEQCGTILIAAHGNSLRALAMTLLHLSPEEIISVEIPTGSPWIFETDEKLNVTNNYYL
ncbi:MAG: 2,3-diphosphoglycerate-dependent phosphoglycerate mutase [Muribaculaceae bacterium]